MGQLKPLRFLELHPFKPKLSQPGRINQQVAVSCGESTSCEFVGGEGQQVTKHHETTGVGAAVDCFLTFQRR